MWLLGQRLVSVEGRSQGLVRLTGMQILLRLHEPFRSIVWQERAVLVSRSVLKDLWTCGRRKRRRRHRRHHACVESGWRDLSLCLECACRKDVPENAVLSTSSQKTAFVRLRLKFVLFCDCFKAAVLILLCAMCAALNAASTSDFPIRRAQ